MIVINVDKQVLQSLWKPW